MRSVNRLSCNHRDAPTIPGLSRSEQYSKLCIMRIKSMYFQRVLFHGSDVSCRRGIASCCAPASITGSFTQIQMSITVNCFRQKPGEGF